MSNSKAALLIHDGELSFVREALEDLRVEFEELRASKVDANQWTPPLDQPLVTTAPVAAQIVAKTIRSASTRPMAPRIAIIRSPSRSQTSLLQRAGFELFVPEHVHPAALRTFLAQVHFSGSNRREARRISFGSPIRCVVGFRRHSCVLIDLSRTGCGLLLDRAIAEGRRVTVAIPRDKTPLRICGRVTRVTEAPEGRGPGHWVGVQFAGMNKAQRRALVALLKARRTGPATWTDPMPAAAVEEPGPEERRVYERVPIEADVEAMCSGATRMLRPVDLSEEGMLVQPNNHLAVSQRLRLALQPSSVFEPLIIEARVLRNDGSRGLALHFDHMEPETREHLRNMIRAAQPDGEP